MQRGQGFGGMQTQAGERGRAAAWESGAGGSRTEPRVRRAILGQLMLGAVAVAALLTGCDESVPAGEPIRVEAVFGALGDTPGRFGYPRAICADAKSDSVW